MASSKDVVTIEAHKSDPRIAVLTICKEPVNSMNLDFWKALLAAFEKVEADASVRCIMFQSGLKKNVFTAGLDLQELYAPKTNESRQHEFWSTLTKCLVSIYGSQKLTVAAVAGACPAGGCCLAMCCDVRVITEDGSMGLNEVALGIPVPTYWTLRMQEIIGHRETQRLLFGALMPKASELLKIGMVDHVVPVHKSLEETRAGLFDFCTEHVRKTYLNFPTMGFQAVKSEMRKGLHDAWAKGGPTEEAALVWKACKDPKTVENLTAVFKRLQKPKKPQAPKSKL